MAIINIRGHSVEVDITEELREYDFGHNARWSPGKLVASSPFRDDNAPSFFVNLTGEYAGTWGDSGSIDEQYSRGNFVALIAYLRGIGYEEAEEYLLDKYGALYEIKPDEPIRIATPKLSERRAVNNGLPADLVTQAISPYLITRGISEEAQRKFAVGYGEDIPGYTAIPWHDTNGRLANVKYRSTSGKKFFYAKDATPVSSLVYGLDFFAGEGDVGEAVLCEGEIDALSWETAGISAIAIGGSHMSREQADLIKRSKIRRLYLGGDNDEQGRKLNAQIERLLGGYIELVTISYGAHNDANDVLMAEGVDELVKITDKGIVGNRLQFRNIIVI